MELDYSQVAALEPALARQLIPEWLRGYVEGDPARAEAFVQAARDALEATSDPELASLLRSFATIGSEYVLYPAEPAARRLSRASMAHLVTEARVEGAEGLLQAARGPCLMLSNHLSYVDTQVTDLLIATRISEDLADRIVAVAGPKVYGSPFRRLASISLSTLKTAQSAGLSHNEAGLSPREVGRIALATVERAGELMAEGHPILIYAEGSRTRTGRLQPFLRAVGKYAALPDVTVVPVAIEGTDRLFPLDQKAMRPAAVRLVFGEPFPAAGLGARGAVELCWRRVAEALSEDHRPDPETPPLG